MSKYGEVDNTVPMKAELTIEIAYSGVTLEEASRIENKIREENKNARSIKIYINKDESNASTQSHWNIPHLRPL